ncbi:MAG: hypothetical protein Q8L24_00215 [bacterium]|nr:hypothetical protein [bacterium]
MSRRGSMPEPRRPFVVMPAVYELDCRRGWCRMRDVCSVARRLARTHNLDIKITSEELIRRFADLIRPNHSLPAPVDRRFPDGVPKVIDRNKKIFRYSKDGNGFWGTEVPPLKKGESWFSSFKLDIGIPYPATMFVPKEWAEDVFNAIRKGAVSARDYGDGHVLGFYSENDKDCRVFTLRNAEQTTCLMT